MNKYIAPFLTIIMAKEDIVTLSMGDYDITQSDIDWEDEAESAFN